MAAAVREQTEVAWTGDEYMGYSYTSWKLANPDKYKFKCLRQRAERKGIPFSLTFSEFLQIEKPTHCPILGIELIDYTNKFIGTNGGHSSMLPDSYSFDRIDSNKGYEKGNCQWISFIANKIKGSYTINELESVLKYLKSL